MARALLPHPLLCQRPKGCRSRASLRRHKQACDGNTCACHGVNRLVRKTNVLRSHAAQRCQAGMTASHENTHTQASDPPGRQSVTQEMFRRAERYASTVGPGIVTMLQEKYCIHSIRSTSHCALAAAGGAGGNSSYAALQGADAAWAKVKAQEVSVLACVSTDLMLLQLTFRQAPQRSC